MKLSEKMFLWFSTMVAVMLLALLLLVALQKQGIFSAAMVFPIAQEPIGEMTEEPFTELQTEEASAKATGGEEKTAIATETATETEASTGTETATETVPQAVLDMSGSEAETASEESDPYPYYIKVNKTQNCVTIYEKDEAGEYTVPVKAMICSTGYATPLGTFDSKGKYVMKGLINGVFGQYSTWITGNILFHSVPSSRATKDSVSVRNYNQLGTTASAGCIRLTVADAKWIYDNCELGTLIEIYEGEDPGPLGKPEAIKLPDGSKWDPTDPDSENPWHECEPTILAEEQIILYYGQEWTPYEDIVALDTCGNDITEKIEISGEVNCLEPGLYEVGVSVTDALGKTAEASCEYFVLATPNPENMSLEDAKEALRMKRHGK